MVAEIIDLFNSLPGGKETATLATFLVLTIIFSIATKIVLTLLKLVTQKTKTNLDDEIIKKSTGAIYYLALLTAAYIAVYAHYGDIKIEGIALIDFYVVGVFIFSAVFINRIIDVLLVWYAEEITPAKHMMKAKDVFLFVRNVVKILVYVAFAILALGKLGIEVAPLVASLGIAGLAVALALQDTLSNFFAGIHILADKPFKEGEYIKLENGMEGIVSAIGWRTTKITTAAKSDVIIPNAKLAQSIVINYYTQTKAIGIFGEIGVDYCEDVEKVGRIILETIKSVQKKNPKIVQNIEPWVRFERFGNYALIFKYGYTVENYNVQFQVLDEVNKALFYAFRKNKIKIK